MQNGGVHLHWPSLTWLAAASVLAGLSCRSKGAVEDPLQATTLVLPHVEIVAPDASPAAALLSAAQRVTDCYGDGLVVHPDQRGQLTFSLQTPADGGSVAIALRATGSLDAQVLECARRALAFVRPPLVGTLQLDPVEQRAPAPPTAATLRKVLATRYAGWGDVVRITDLTIERVRQHGAPLVRAYDYTVHVEFVKEGYDTTCQGEERVYKVFEQGLVPRPDHGDCKSEPRRVGDRAVEESYWPIELTGEGWQVEVGDDAELYCGDRLCPRR